MNTRMQAWLIAGTRTLVLTRMRYMTCTLMLTYTCTCKLPPSSSATASNARMGFERAESVAVAVLEKDSAEFVVRARRFVKFEAENAVVENAWLARQPWF